MLHISMYTFVLPAFSGFVLGIAFRSFYDFGISFILFCIGLSAILWSSNISRQRLFVVISIVIFSFGIGMARMHFAVPSVALNPPFGQEVSFEGTIIREPDIRGTYTNLIIESDSFEYRVLVRTSSYTEFNYADTVFITGVFENVRNFSGEGDRIFNYRGYLGKDNIHAIVASPDIVIRAHNATIVGSLLALKKNYLNSLKHILPEPSASLAGGITVGERRSLGDTLTEEFRTVGLIHIVVLSGYNIAIIVIFINALLLALPQRARQMLAILSIVAFTILVGASATVVRAAIMGCIGSLGVMASRTYDARHALLIAGLVMLIWNPYLLVYDPSFQLSFIATLGLLMGLPLRDSFFSFIPEAFGLRDIASATVTTQIATLPLLAYMMGTVSVVALMVNLLVLPIVPLAMLLTFLTGIVSFLSSTLALVIGWCTHGILTYIITLVGIFAQLPHASFSVPTFSFVYVVLVYIVLGIGAIRLQHQNVQVPHSN